MSNETASGNSTSAGHESGSDLATPPGDPTDQQPARTEDEGVDHRSEQQGEWPVPEAQDDWPVPESHVGWPNDTVDQEWPKPTHRPEQQGDWPEPEAQDDWPVPQSHVGWTNDTVVQKWPEPTQEWIQDQDKVLDSREARRHADLVNRNPELFTVYEQDMAKPVDTSVIAEAHMHLLNAKSYFDLEKHTTLFAYLDGMGRVCPYLPIEVQESIRSLLQLRQDRAKHDEGHCAGFHATTSFSNPTYTFIGQATSSAQLTPHHPAGASSDKAKEREVHKPSSVNEVEGGLKDLKIGDSRERPDVADILMPDCAWMCQEDDISKVMAAAHYIYSFDKLGKSLEDEEEAALRNVARPLALQMLYQGGVQNIEASEIFLKAFTGREKYEALNKEIDYDILYHRDDDESPDCSDIDSDFETEDMLMVTAPKVKGRL